MISQRTAWFLRAVLRAAKPCVYPSFWSFHQCPFLTTSEISDKPAHHHDLGFLIRSLSTIGHNAVKLTRLFLPCICPFQRLADVGRGRVSKSDIDFVKEITITREVKQVQTWTGPGDSGRLRFPDFKTIGTWSWQGCQPYAPAAFTPQEIFLVVVYIRGWVDPRATAPPSGTEPTTFRLVAKCLN
jgi:hypothetical protein